MGGGDLRIPWIPVDVPRPEKIDFLVHTGAHHPFFRRHDG